MPAGQRRLGRVGDGVKRRIEILGLERALDHALRREVEGGEHAAQAGVRRQRPDQGLRLNDLIGEVLDVLLRQEKQTVLLEEAAAIGTPYRFEDVLLTGELRGERRGGIRGLIRRLRVDHHREKIDILRKRLFERLLELTPGQVGVDELIDVGIDADVCRAVEAADDGKREQHGRDDEGVAPAGIDETDDERQHCRLRPRGRSAE